MNRLVPFLLVLLGLVAGACRDSMPPDNDTPAALSLPSTIWRLESIERNGQLERIAATTTIMLRFDASTISGVGPCNPATGAYAVDGAAMTITRLTSGDRSCDSADLEERYLGHLRAVGSYIATATTLKLYASGGSVVLTYSRASAMPGGDDTIPHNVDPRGRPWRLVKIEGGGAIDTLTEGPWVTLTLAARAGGAGPCNPYSVAYTIDSVTLRTRDLQIGDQICPRIAREDRYINALLTAQTYHSTERSLRIMYAGGVLHYVPHEAPIDTVPNAPIVDREWRLALIAEDDDTIEVMRMQTATLTFGNNRELDGFGPCSRYAGTYASDGRSLTITALDEGRINCIDRPLEERYFRLLRMAARYSATDSTLRIITREGATLLFQRFAPAGKPLGGTSWKLEKIAVPGGRETFPSGLFRLSFADRTLDGVTVCDNRYDASYTVGPRNRITVIPPINRTEKGCPDSPFETAYFRVLSEVVEFRNGNDRLILHAPAATLYFRPL